MTLTATVRKYSSEINYWVNRVKSFDIGVARTQHTDVSNDTDYIDIVYASGDSASNVRSSLYLATMGSTGSNITWSSNNTNYITNTGRVTRPGPDGTDIGLLY